jgi:hypothetical protein
LRQPKALKTPLAHAATRQEGFLMRHQPQLAGGQSTTLAFAADTCTRR